jgi:sigma-B regulation protein RsbU (phosphoserine phosphatase)
VRAGGTVESAPAAGGMVLGIEAEVRFETQHATLGPGDLMVLYSDGVTEAANSQDEFYGDERLAEALATTAGADEKAAIAAVSETVRQFAAGYKQSDDITLVAVRRKPA